MYVVREKASKKVLHVNPAPLRQNLSGKDVYFKYNPDTMEVGRSDGRLPQHYDIDAEGMIVALTLKEQVNRGLLTLADDEAVFNNHIRKIPHHMKVVSSESGKDELVELSLKEKSDKGLITVNEPFEYIDEKKNAIIQRSLLELVNKKLLTSKDIAQQLGHRLDKQIANEIGQSVSPGDEMKLIKGYMAWIVDGQPAKDSREKAYLEMQNRIAAIKEKYVPVKKAIAAFRGTKKNVSKTGKQRK